MNIYPHVKKDLKSFFKEGKIIIITFLLFPMIMAYIYGIMQQDLFSGKSSFEPIAVEFKYDKNTQKGKMFASILQSSDVKKFIIENDDDIGCKISISDNFETIDIKNIKCSDTELIMVKSFMKLVCENMNQYNVIMNNVDKLSLNSEDKGELVSKLLQIFNKNSQESGLVEKIVPGFRTLSSREYYTISMFSFTSILLILTLAKTFFNEKKNGVLKRCYAAPNKKEAYLFGQLISNFIIISIINGSYVGLNSAFNIAFREHLLLNITIAVFQSMLQTAVIAAITTFIKSEQVANGIMTVFIITSVIIGGVFFNVDLIGIKIIKLVSAYSPNVLILNAYKDLAVAGNINGINNQIISMILVSLVLIVCCIIYLRIRSDE